MEEGALAIGMLALVDLVILVIILVAWLSHRVKPNERSDDEPTGN